MIANPPERLAGLRFPLPPNGEANPLNPLHHF